MRQPIFSWNGGGAGGLLTGGLLQIMPNYFSGNTEMLLRHEQNFRSVWPSSGVISNLYYAYDPDVFLIAKPTTYLTLFKNGSATSLVAYNSAILSGNDTFHQVNVQPGDFLSFEHKSTSTPDNIGYSFCFEPSIPDEFVIIGSNLWDLAKAGANNAYVGAMGVQTNLVGGVVWDGLFRNIFPVSGTLSNLTVHLTRSDNVSECSVFVRKNGVDTDLSLSYLEFTNDLINTTNTVSVVAGDTINIHFTSAVSSTFLSWGMIFRPNSSGFAPVLQFNDNMYNADKTDERGCGFEGEHLFVNDDGVNFRETVLPVPGKFKFSSMYVSARSAFLGVNSMQYYFFRVNSDGTYRRQPLLTTIIGELQVGGSPVLTASDLTNSFICNPGDRLLIMNSCNSPINGGSVDWGTIGVCAYDLGSSDSASRPMIFHTKNNSDPIIFYERTDGIGVDVSAILHSQQ